MVFEKIRSWLAENFLGNPMEQCLSLANLFQQLAVACLIIAAFPSAPSQSDATLSACIGTFASLALSHYFLNRRKK